MEGSTPKQTFLAVYDYGQGGIWVLIDARSAQEVEAVYPDLKVFIQRPAWMRESDVADLEQKFHFDVDAPTGWLTMLTRKSGV